MKKTILAFTFLALVGTAPTLMAQDVEREQERREEAERQLLEAQTQLERALTQLRESQTQAARRDLDEAMAAMRAAQRELTERGRYTIMRQGRPDDVRVFSFGDNVPQVAFIGDDRPRIGVLVQTNRDGETDPTGAVLTAVTPGGPADEAGLQAGDIVTEANGISLETAGGRRSANPGERFVEIVGALEEGGELHVTYRRDGQIHMATLSPRVMDSSNSYSYAFGDSPDFVFEPGMITEFMTEPRIARLRVEPSEMIARIVMPHRWLNVELVTLDEDLGAYFGTSEGLLVVRAPGDSDLGLRSGDVILSIDGRAPTSPSHALRILRSYDQGESVSMQIMRNKSRTTVDFMVPENDWQFPR